MPGLHCSHYNWYLCRHLDIAYKLVSWYFEPRQPQRITSRLKTMFSLSPIYSARKSSYHKLSINHKISLDRNLHKTKHTQTSNTTFSKGGERERKRERERANAHGYINHSHTFFEPQVACAVGLRAFPPCSPWNKEQQLVVTIQKAENSGACVCQ